jgi:hypothetical protein
MFRYEIFVYNSLSNGQDKYLNLLNNILGWEYQSLKSDWFFLFNKIWEDVILNVNNHLSRKWIINFCNQ